ncbi:cupredoxin domain-containing protein [Kineococcus esterisolvens]|uniref:cupredoxin domain-containing protein n=1 Tax=Kineococcus sp. SYSU DK009 TaxID=3383130 RepID=UPI003D7DD367
MRRRALLGALLTAPGAAAAASCGRGSAAAPVPPAVSVVVRNIAFDPAEVEVRRGDAVEWVFDDGGILHQVRGDGFDSGVVGAGTFRHTFTAAGEHPYVCSVHPHMTGVVRVVDGG